MASAKNEAIKSLGKENDYINLSGLNTERQLANDVFNTNRTTFQNAYNDLLNTVAKNRADAKTGFTQGRGTVGENAYFANRDNLATLSSRGVDEGTYALGKLRNRINTGQQYSDLANTYYRNLDEINATETAGRNEYDYNMATAQNTLNAALADIDAREKAGRNAYKAAVAQLAEQIQARRDVNANAAAARKLTQQQIAADKKKAEDDFVNKTLVPQILAAMENAKKNKKSATAAALDIYRSQYGKNKTYADLGDFATKYGFMNYLR